MKRISQSAHGYKSPCKDCEKREIGCHSKCEQYLEFKRKVEASRQQEVKYKAARDAWYESTYGKSKVGKKRGQR